MDIMRVSGSSIPSKVAGAIAGVMRDTAHVEVQAIGASAVNQSVKAIAMARKYLEHDGIEMIFFPELVDIEINNQLRTAIKFTVERRR